MVFLFTKLAEVRGVVRPVVNQDLHLSARLADGRLILGQHRLTGKNEPPLSSPIVKLGLNQGLDQERPASAAIRPKVARLVATAELICYPVGSFYSSLLASLLPSGIGEAVAANPCPKVFVPNTAPDSEALTGVAQRVAELLGALGAQEGARRDGGRVLITCFGPAVARLSRRMGSPVPGRYGPGGHRDRTSHARQRPLTDGRLLAEALLSLV